MTIVSESEGANMPVPTPRKNLCNFVKSAIQPRLENPPFHLQVHSESPRKISG